MINRAKLIIQQGMSTLPSSCNNVVCGSTDFCHAPSAPGEMKILVFFSSYYCKPYNNTNPDCSLPLLVARDEGEGWRKIEFVSRVIFKAVDYRQLRGESVFKYCPGETTKKRSKRVRRFIRVQSTLV